MNRLFFTTIAALTVVAACSKAEIAKTDDPVSDGSVCLTVSAQTPTKVCFNDENQLVWEGSESIGILLGNNDSNEDTSTSSNQELTTVSTGIFSGNVDQSKFSLSDVKGLVYPFDTQHYYRYDGSAGRIVMCVGADKDNPFPEVQKSNGKLNGQYAPLFCTLTDSELIEKDGAYKVEGKQFKWGCALVRFNVYGTTAGLTSTEVLKSISLYTNAGKAIVGRSEYNMSTNKFVFNGKTSNIATVQLEEACTIADKTQENGIKVFMALLPRGAITTGSGAYVSITTDKAEYRLDLASVPLTLNAGEVRLVGLNLANFHKVGGGEEEEDHTPSTLPGTTWIDEEVW